MKVTQWFKPEEKPVHVGEYQGTVLGKYERPPMYFWDGQQWRYRDTSGACFFQDVEWRGLAEKP